MSKLVLILCLVVASVAIDLDRRFRKKARVRAVDPPYQELQDSDPAALMNPGSLAMAFHLAFNTHGSSSRRVFDEVHYVCGEIDGEEHCRAAGEERGDAGGDPFLTFGMAHWAQGSARSFFDDLKSKDIDTYNRFMDLCDEHLSDSKKQTMKEQAGISTTSVKDAIEKLFCVDGDSDCDVYERWQTSVSEDFNSRDQWFTDCWKHAGMDKTIAEFQVRQWVADSTIEKGQAACYGYPRTLRDFPPVGVKTIGGVASCASVASSSLHLLANTNELNNDRAWETEVKDCGEGYPAATMTWPYDSVPDGVKKDGVEYDDDKLLEDWRSLIVYKEYQREKAQREDELDKCRDYRKYNRERMNSFWCLYFERAFGWPSPKLTELPKHNGNYMWKLGENGFPDHVEDEQFIRQDLTDTFKPSFFGVPSWMCHFDQVCFQVCGNRRKL